MLHWEKVWNGLANYFSISSTWLSSIHTFWIRNLGRRWERMISYLVESSFQGLTCLPQCTITSNPCTSRLLEIHFQKRIIDGRNGHLCWACNFTKNQLVKLGFPPVHLNRKTTSFYCKQCNIPLCVTPCFEIFHTVQDYKTGLIRTRMQNVWFISHYTKSFYMMIFTILYINFIRITSSLWYTPLVFYT